MSEGVSEKGTIDQACDRALEKQGEMTEAFRRYQRLSKRCSREAEELSEKLRNLEGRRSWLHEMLSAESDFDPLIEWQRRAGKLLGRIESSSWGLRQTSKGGIGSPELDDLHREFEDLVDDLGDIQEEFLEDCREFENRCESMTYQAKSAGKKLEKAREKHDAVKKEKLTAFGKLGGGYLGFCVLLAGCAGTGVTGVLLGIGVFLALIPAGLAMSEISSAQSEVRDAEVNVDHERVRLNKIAAKAQRRAEYADALGLEEANEYMLELAQETRSTHLLT